MKTNPFGTSRTHPKRLLLLLAALSCFAASPLTAGEPATISTEDKVKATYLLKFAEFVEWPAAAFTDATTPLTIGVLGADEFGPFLDALIKGETIKGRVIVIHRANKIADLPACHILFISKSEKAEIPRILARVAKTGVLTVGEVEGFTRSGGLVNFCLSNGKIRFAINAAGSRRAGLIISAQLLQLSQKGCL